MSGYVAACYGVTIGALVGYSSWVVYRYRAVVKRRSNDDGSAA